MPKTEYKDWISGSETTGEELGAMEQQVAGFAFLPLVSIALVVSDADEVWIRSSVGSVLSQIYPHLELCVCDNGSKRPHVREVLDDLAAAEERLKVRRLEEKKSQAKTYNAAVSMATGEFVALLEGGDEMAPDALFKVVELLQRVRAEVVYTDEDHIDVSGERLNPAFKPYWSPDLSLSTAYTGRLCVMRRELLDALGAFREGFEGAEEYDLILRLSEKTDRIFHLPGVLYHRRILPEQTNPGGARDTASLRAAEEARVRRREDSTVEPAKGSLRVIRRVAGYPKVGVIVSAPQGMVEAPVVDELEERTSYPIHQVIVATGGQRVHSAADHVGDPFATRALNLAASKSDCEYLVFIDGGARVAYPDWLSEMLSQAQRRGIGAVGCKLSNPDGSLRHGGSLVEVSKLTGHPDVAAFGVVQPPPLVEGAFNFAAASAGGMMVRRAVFEEAGGFDDERLPTAFYDLDLSFRLRESGLLNVYTPYASLAYGSPNPLPGEEEIAYMWRRWWEQLVQLLYYRWSPLHMPSHRTSREAPILFSS